MMRACEEEKDMHMYSNIMGRRVGVVSRAFYRDKLRWLESPFEGGGG